MFAVYSQNQRVRTQKVGTLYYVHCPNTVGDSPSVPRELHSWPIEHHFAQESLSFPSYVMLRLTGAQISHTKWVIISVARRWMWKSATQHGDGGRRNLLCFSWHTGTGSVLGWTVRRRGKWVRRWRWLDWARVDNGWRRTACRPCGRWHCRVSVCRRNTWMTARWGTVVCTDRHLLRSPSLSGDRRSVSTVHTDNMVVQSIVFQPRF